MIDGKGNAQNMFMSGKLKVKGDVMKATKMVSLPVADPSAAMSQDYALYCMLTSNSFRSQSSSVRRTMPSCRWERFQFDFGLGAVERARFVDISFAIEISTKCFCYSDIG